MQQEVGNISWLHEVVYRLIMLFQMYALMHGLLMAVPSFLLSVFLNLPRSGLCLSTGFSLEFVCVSEH